MRLEPATAQYQDQHPLIRVQGKPNKKKRKKENHLLQPYKRLDVGVSTGSSECCIAKPM